MCRNEAPVNYQVFAAGKLAEHLRHLRDNAELSNPSLARKLKVDIVTIRRAASGTTVPKRSLVEAWTQACGGKTEKSVGMWRQARYQYRRIHLRRPYTSLPNPDLVSTQQTLSEALVELYERAGAPSYREMEQRGGSYGVLPRNTARRIVLRQTLPVSEEQFVAYLQACEVRRPNAWIGARNRITSQPEATSAVSEYIEPPVQTLQRLRPTRVKASATPTTSELQAIETWQESDVYSQRRGLGLRTPRLGIRPHINLKDRLGAAPTGG